MPLNSKLLTDRGYGMLEPDVVKVASPVLRGLGAGDGSRLLGGYETLERHEVKVSRTVLRRGRASSRSFLIGEIRVLSQYYS